MNTTRYIALAILVALAGYPAFGQCDTIAPSGKVLFSDPGEWRTETGYPRSIQVLDSMQYFTTRVRVDCPCVVVKAFGCPTCGSEEGQWHHTDKHGTYVGIAFADPNEVEAEKRAALNVCSECGTVYSGRRRE